MDPDKNRAFGVVSTHPNHIPWGSPGGFQFIGLPQSMDGLFHGKSQKMPWILGYPKSIIGKPLKKTSKYDVAMLQQ
jgi:hypothetical protein